MPTFSRTNAHPREKERKVKSLTLTHRKLMEEIDTRGGSEEGRHTGIQRLGKRGSGGEEKEERLLILGSKVKCEGKRCKIPNFCRTRDRGKESAVLALSSPTHGTQTHRVRGRTKSRTRRRFTTFTRTTVCSSLSRFRIRL